MGHRREVWLYFGKLPDRDMKRDYVPLAEIHLTEAFLIMVGIRFAGRLLFVPGRRSVALRGN